MLPRVSGKEAWFLHPERGWLHVKLDGRIVKVDGLAEPKSLPYVSPLAAIALQWYTKLKYISSMPLSVGIGATVISAKAWNAMPEAHKKALLEAQEKWHLVLIRKVRRDNKRSLKLLLENGLQVAQVTDEAKKEWRQLAHKVERALSGKIYPASLLMKVKQLIKDYRAGKR